MPLEPECQPAERTGIGWLEQTRLGSEDGFIGARTPVEAALSKLWQAALGLERVGIRDDFFDLGGNSLRAARLFGQIEGVFGRKLSMAALFQAPTIEQLARIIQDGEQPARWSPLVAIQPGGTRPPFFCVHGVGGNVLGYRDLARYLGPDQPFYGLQARDLDDQETNQTGIAALAAQYVVEIKAVPGEGPYFLGGLSFGGLVAYEMAQHLTTQGNDVSLLALFDTPGPGYPHFLPAARRIRCHLRNLKPLSIEEKRTYVRVRTQALAEWIEWGLWNLILRVHPASALPFSHTPRTVRLARLRAACDYVPASYPGRVTLFRAAEQPVGCRHDPQSGWSRVALGSLEIREVPGNHVSIVQEPHVRVLASQLRQCMQEAVSVRIGL